MIDSLEEKIVTSSIIRIAEKPLVSVQMITYNHECYIEDAIEGVLKQKTTFNIELVIGEDLSTDSTREICIKYAKKYPGIIKLLPSECNVGMIRNALRTINACTGKYIAVCEGDDYWIDPYKLQKQFDYLDSNSDYGMVFSKVRVYIEKNKKFKKDCFGKIVSSLDDLLIQNSICTPSVMFRKELYYDYLKEINPENKNWLMGDYSFWLYIASKSKIKFFNYPSSVYRVLENSAAHSNDFIKAKLFLENTNDIQKYYINKLGYNHLENKIYEKLLIHKTYLYLFRNEDNVSDLIKEINDYKNKTFRLIIINILLKKRLFRKILKLAWSI